MTATTAVPAWGSAIQRQDPNTSAWVTLKNVTNIQPGGPKRKFADTSQMQGAGWTEHTPTLNDGGTVTADIDFVPTDATHIQLRNDQINGTIANYRAAFPDGNYVAYAAYVEGIPPDMKVSDVIKAKVTWQSTGPVTYSN